MSDLTILHYTANALPEAFAQRIRDRLAACVDGKYPIISISQKPMDFGENIFVGDIGRSVYNIYRQALIGAKSASTEYVACSEDDTLYVPEHFDYRGDTFCYNDNHWKIHDGSVYFTSGRPIFSACIVPREIMIKTLESRFEKYPRPEMVKAFNFGEPGGYEWRLKLPEVKYHTFHTDKAIIAFNHRYATHGRRRVSGTVVTELPYWGPEKSLWEEIYA
jgi:hypothetical protein